MRDVFPLIYQTAKDAAYFENFNDSAGRFKFFEGDESPTVQTPFVTVDVDTTTQSQRTNWHAPFVTFHVTGEQTDTALLWEIANTINDYFRSMSAFSDGTVYQLMGDSIFSQGINPVTEHRVVSVAMRFGLV